MSAVSLNQSPAACGSSGRAGTEGDPASPQARTMGACAEAIAVVDGGVSVEVLTASGRRRSDAGRRSRRGGWAGLAA